MAFQTVLDYVNANSFDYDGALIEISGGSIRLKDLGGATYSTANPSITTQHRTMAINFEGYSQTATIPALTQIKFCAVVNDINYWYNSSNARWEVSDGTYAQSNTGAELNTHGPAMFVDIGILVIAAYMRLKVFLHSDNGTARPTLTQSTISFLFENETPTLISECVLTAYLGDLLGDVPTYDSTKPTTLYVACDRGFFHGNKFIFPFTKTVDFDIDGIATMSLIETETPGVKLSFAISYFDGNSRKMTKLFSAMVPNTAAAALDTVTVPRYVDYG